MGIEWTYFNLVKYKYDKPTTSGFQCWKTESFSLRPGRKQGSPLLPIFFNVVLEILATAIWDGKEQNPDD